ncbi:hypothetical protein ACFS5L_41045 [Streptomyces phyllanthi]|uniref:Uncharacterized protein n=1 Tax=Streptomyces phyllanthi TaxID=1803180 RepID=A0A5N8W817_9ACTN|nr:hypothetical protein [Streptomyces phyllanthi]MPY43036.1 hypothetical protein [Streptomyces phyllanthi]
MSGPRFGATALPHARGGWVRLLLVVLVVSATFALFCVASPPGRAAGAAVSPSKSVPSAVSGSLPDGRPEARASRHADREPCEERPGGHHCGGPHHHGVLGQTPLVGVHRTPAPGQPVTAPARGSLAPSREPGAARPPDLHTLQLLRV